MDQPFCLIDKSAVQEDKGKALERNLFAFHYFCAIKKKKKSTQSLSSLFSISFSAVYLKGRVDSFK